MISRDYNNFFGVRQLLTINDNIDIEQNKFDVTAFGEVLVDMISEQEAPLKECRSFSRHFGGSPANVLVNLQRLDNSTAIISRIGRDDFGEYLQDILETEGVNLNCLQKDDEASTPIIFVNKSKATPSWLPYRGADIKIEESELIYRTIDQSSIFFIGGFILSKSPARMTGIRAVEYAVENNKILAFDPSYRAKLWHNKQRGIEIVKDLIDQSYFIKPSLDDAYHLFGSDSPENYLKKYHKSGASIVILTMGGKGLLLSDGKNEPIHMPVYSENVLDVTGAGDAFWSGFLSGILRGLKVKTAAEVGSAASAFKIQGIGALSEIPKLKEMMDHYNIKPAERRGI